MSYSTLMTNIWPPPNDEVKSRLERLQELKQLREKRDASGTGTLRTDTRASEGSRISRRQLLNTRTLPTSRLRERQEERLKATLERKSQDDQLSASQEALSRASYGGARPKNISASLRPNSSGTSEILASIRKNEDIGLNHHERQRTFSAESDTFEDHGPNENVIYQSTSARLTSIGSLGSLTDERETEVKAQDVSVESESADHIEDIESFKQSLYGPANSPAKVILQERVLTPFTDPSCLMDASEFSSRLLTSTKSESRGKVGDSARWRRNFPQSAGKSSLRSENQTQSSQEQTSNGNQSIQGNGGLDISVEKTTVKPSESGDKTVAASIHTDEQSGSSETTIEKQNGSDKVIVFDGESMKVMGRSNDNGTVPSEKESVVSPHDTNVVQSSHENSVENESFKSGFLDSSNDQVLHGSFNISDQLSNFSVQSQADTSDYRESILDESDSIFDTKYESVLEEDAFPDRDSWLSDRSILGEGSMSYSNRSAWQTDRPTFDRSGGYAPKQSRRNVLTSSRAKPSTTRISRYTSLPNSTDSRIAGFRSKYLNRDYPDSYTSSYGGESNVTSSYIETESEDISSRLGNILSDSFKKFDSVLDGSDVPKKSDDSLRNLRRSYSQKVDSDNDSRFSRFRRTSETNGESDFDSSISRYRRSSETNSDGEFRSRYDTGSSSLQLNPGMHEFISDIRSRISGERVSDTTRSSSSKPLARTSGGSSVLENAKKMLLGITDEPEVGVHDQQFENLRHQTELLTETLVGAEIDVNVTENNVEISGSDVQSEEDVIVSEAQLEKGDIIQLTPEPDKQLGASEKEAGVSEGVELDGDSVLVNKVVSDSVTSIGTETVKDVKDEETSTGKVDAENVVKCSENDDNSDNATLVKVNDTNSKEQISNKGKSKKKKKGKKKKNSDSQSDASNNIDSKSLDGKKIEISQSEDVLTVTIEDTKGVTAPQEVESTGSVGKQFEGIINDIDHRSEKTSVATEDLLSLIGKGEENESLTSKTGSTNSKKTVNKSNKDSTDTTSSQIPDENFATFEGEDPLALTKNENVSMEGSSLLQTDAEQFETASEEEFYEALPGEMVDEDGNVYVEHREQFIYVTAGSKVRKKKLSKKSLLGEKSSQEVNSQADVHDSNLDDRMKSQVNVDSSRIGHVKEWMESNIFPSNNALDEKDFRVESSDQGSHFSLASTIGDFDSRGSLDSKDKSDDGKTIKNVSVFSSDTSGGSTLSEKKNSSMQTNVSLLNTRDSATQMLIKSRNIGVQIDAEMFDKFVQTIGELVCPCCKHKFNIQEGFSPTADDIKVNDKDVQKVKEELKLKLEIKIEQEDENKPGSLKTSSNSSASSKSSSSRNSMATPPKSPSIISSASSTKRSPRGTPNEKSPNVTPRKQSPSAVKRTQSLGEKPNRKSPSTTPRKHSPARKSPVTTPRKQSPSRKSPSTTPRKQSPARKSGATTPRKQSPARKSGATTPRKQSPAREGARTPNTKASPSHQGGQTNGEINKGPSSKVRKERVASVQDLLYQNGEQTTEKKPEGKRRPTTPGPKREKSSERQKREASGDRRSDDGSSEKSDLPGYMQPTKSSRKKKSIGNKDDLLEDGKQKKGTTAPKSNTETDEHDAFTTLNENPFIRSDRQSSTGANGQRSSGKWYRKEPLKYEEEHKKGKPRTPKKQRSTSTSSEKTLSINSDMKMEKMLKSNEKLNVSSLGSQSSLLETDLDEAMGCKIDRSEADEDEFTETVPYQSSHFLGPDLKSYAENVSRNIAEVEVKKLTSNSNQNEDVSNSNGQLSLPPGAESEKNETEVTQTLDEKDGEGSKQKLLSDEEQTGVPVETESGQDEVAPVRVNLTSWDPTKLLSDLYAVKLMPDTAKDISDKFVAMEGLMEKLPMNKKKATLLKTWKRRFFRATDGWLYYYETSNHDKPSDSLQLMGGKVEDLGNRILGVDDGRGKFLMVRCPSDKEYGQWKLALESQTADNVKATYVRPVLSCPPHPQKKVILIDLGSSAIRAGILGEHATLPSVFFPNMVARSTDSQGHAVGIEAFEPEYRKNLSKTVHPTDKVDKDFLRPFSIDISTIGAVFKKIFTDLKVEPADYWLMISTPQNLGDKIRAGLMEVLMDTHHVLGVCMVMQSLLALYSYNATSGIIVDVGERMEILPIYDGFVIEGGVSRQSYGGQKVIESLNSCLHGYKFSTPIQQLLVRYVMEQSCYLVTDYKDTMKKCEQDPEHYKTTVYLNNFDLPEGAALEVTHDYSCFKSPEGFFNTDLWGMDYPCVHKLVFQAIQSCPIDSRKRMYRAIYLSGGVTLLPGFAERLQSELQTLAPPSVIVEVHASPQRYHSAFIGACSLASMEQFQQICISAEEWKKEGVKAFKKWNMAG